MTTKAKLMDDGRTVTVRVPISIRRRGGRKLILAPSGANVPTAPVCRHIDNAMVKAVARAFRWREMLESGECSTIREIAGVEKINESYVCRVLRLSLLSPRIIESILDGHQPLSLRLETLLRPFPADWTAQNPLLFQPRGQPVGSQGIINPPRRYG